MSGNIKRYKRGRWTLIVVMMLWMCATGVLAQPRYIGELGIMGGGSYYNGDLNSTKIFYDTKLTFGGMLRVNVNERFKMKANVLRGKVAADSRDFENALPGGVQVDFEKAFWDIGAHFEHNFFKLGMNYWDREMKRHTPYVLAGPGLTVYDFRNGHKLSFNFTFGVGYKFKLWDCLNLGVEWSMRKLFVDDFDVTNYENKILNDPYNMGHSRFKNNDYYTCAVAFFSVDLIKRKGRCNVLRR